MGKEEGHRQNPGESQCLGVERGRGGGGRGQEKQQERWGGWGGRQKPGMESVQEAGSGMPLRAHGHTEASGFHCVCDGGRGGEPGGGEKTGIPLLGRSPLGIHLLGRAFLSTEGKTWLR